MERFEHFVSMNAHGHRIGPIPLRGPHLDDVYAAQARPHSIAALEQAAKTNAHALPLDKLTNRHQATRPRHDLPELHRSGTACSRRSSSVWAIHSR
ncbi:hypothetical protein ACWCPD_41030 [Streptomyces sp. NPDC001935]